MLKNTVFLISAALLAICNINLYAMDNIADEIEVPSLQDLCLAHLKINDVLADISTLDLTTSISKSLLGENYKDSKFSTNKLSDVLSKRTKRNGLCIAKLQVDTHDHYLVYDRLDNDHFVACSSSGTLKIFNISSCKCIQEITVTTHVCDYDSGLCTYVRMCVLTPHRFVTSTHIERKQETLEWKSYNEIKVWEQEEETHNFVCTKTFNIDTRRLASLTRYSDTIFLAELVDCNRYDRETHLDYNSQALLLISIDGNVKRMLYGDNNPANMLHSDNIWNSNTGPGIFQRNIIFLDNNHCIKPKSSRILLFDFAHELDPIQYLLVFRLQNHKDASEAITLHPDWVDVYEKLPARWKMRFSQTVNPESN